MVSFVEQNAPTALSISQQTGIPYQVLLAIPGNETGWGTAQAGNNYFGIKGSNPNTGANTGQVGTWEVINGQKVNINDTFRAYGGYGESANDFVSFLKTNPRYQPALDYLQKQPNDWRGFVRMVADAGYATDPKWADKIISIGDGIDGTGSAAQGTTRFNPTESGRTGVPSVIDVGSTAIGSKYVWGGSGGRSNFDPNFSGSDCSGFVAWAYQQATGVKLPAYTGSIWDATQSISSDEASPGDLVMYNMNQGDPHEQHVGIYAGNGMMLHDSSINPNGGVDITPLWKGAQFRRVPGVDTSLASYANTNSPSKPQGQTGDSMVEWHIIAHAGHQILQGMLASGAMVTEDMGSTDEKNGVLLGSSTGMGLGETPGGGNDRMGSGQDEINPDPDLTQHLGGAPTPAPSPSLSDLVQPDLGKPYKMAAGRENDMSSDPGDHPAYDCSSFVSSVAARQGYKLSPFTDRMFDETAPVNSGEEQAGDLIFYRYNDPEQRGVTYPHVGFYLGDGRTYEARYDKATGGAVGEYDQLNPSTFKPVFRRMAKPEIGAGQDKPSGSPLEQALRTMIEEAVAKHMGAGQDDAAETFFNPSTGNFEKLQQTPFDASTPPSTALGADDPTKSAAPPVPVAAASALFAKPAEALAGGVGDMASKFNASAQAGTLGSDLASGAGETLGGAFSGLGSLGRGIADKAGDVVQGAQQLPQTVADTAGTVGDTAQALNTATPGAAVAQGVSDLASQIPEKAPEALSALNDAGQALTDLPVTAAGAAVQVGTGAFQAGQQLGQAFSDYAKTPEAQQAAETAQHLERAIDPTTAIPEMLPGAEASVSYLRSMGYDLDALKASASKPADPGSVSARVADTGIQSPGDVLGVGGEVLQYLNDQRVEAVKQAQAPEIRDTVEGQALQQVLAMATDPTMYIGVGEAAAGRKAIEEASTVATKPGVVEALGRAGKAVAEFAADESGELRYGTSEAAKAAEEGSAEAARAAPRGNAEAARNLAAEETRLMSPDSPVAVALDRTYHVDEEIDLLQSAAIDLNDANLEAQSRRLMDGVDKHEPQTGEQLRRTIINAIATANPAMTPEEIIAAGDRVLYNADHPLLTHDAQILAGRAMPDDVFFARQPWWASDSAKAAADAAQAKTSAASTMDMAKRVASIPAEKAGVLHDAIASAAEAAAGAPGIVKRTAGGLATGALAGGSELAYGDENDPNHYGKAVTKGMLGFALGIGAPYIATGISKTVGKAAIEAGQELLAPATKLSKPARDAYAALVGNHAMSQNAGEQLADQWRSVFGDLANADLAAEMEMLGRLPNRVKDLPGAQAAFDRWQAVSEWARKYDIVKDPLGLEGAGQAKMYVPHVLDKEWAAATTRGAEEGKRPGGGGRFNRNPFSTYNKSRDYRTMIEGQANGAQYVDDLPTVLGNYYTRAIQSASNQAFVDKLAQEASVNRPELLGNLMDLVSPGSKGSDILSGADVVRARGRQVPEGMIPLNSLEGFQGFGNLDDVHISPELATVLKNYAGSGDSIWDSALLRQSRNINSIFKHNTLSGSAFHLLNEVRQTFATQGAEAPVNLGKIMWQTTFPGGFRQFMTTNGPLARQAEKDGLTLNVVADRMDNLNLPQRWGLAAMNAGIGSVAGYQTALNSGETNEDALKTALATGIISGAAGSPVIKLDALSPERRSLVEHLSHAMWDRWIPALKLTTYEMYAPEFGGRDAASFVNSVFGGQNLLAIARSRSVQNAASMAALAPDWQEGFARLAGNALFNWGKDAPQGDMARKYWSNALVQHAVVLEGMNLAFGGQFSWQNDPDATLQVNAGRFYDMMGWDHTDPKTGQSYTPYWDILGPFRSMIEPVQETARAATAGAYTASGYDLNKLPLHDEVAGKWGQIPPPDPAGSVGRFISSRAGWLASTAGEVRANYDFAGRPIDQADDNEVQRAINRVWMITNHMQPTGTGEGLKDVAKGDPWPVALFSAATGMRTKREDETTKFFQWQDQFVNENKKNTQDWANLRADSRAQSQAIDQKIEAIQSGAKKNDDGSDMTPRDRNNQIAALAAQRPTQKKDLQGLIDKRNLPDGPEKDELQRQLKEMLSYDIVSGGNDPVDLTGRTDIDPADLFNKAWNKDPSAVDRLTRTSPKPIDFGQGMGASFAESGLGDTLRDVIHNPPGSTPSKELQGLRAQWTEDYAKTWGIDPAVMQDYVKANLYDLPNKTPPPLTGVTSSQLDDIVQGWQDKGLSQNNQPITDPGTAARLRQEYVMATAQELGLDPKDLAQRIKLRNLPMADTTPAGLSRSRALDVLSDSRYYPYQNADGSPKDGPAEWQEYDKKLSAARNRFEFVQKDGKGFYMKDGKVDPELTGLFEDKQRATAYRYRSVFNSPNKDDYYRWFGDGANLTDKQWEQYQAGTLDMWHDNPDPREAKNRNTAMRVWAGLTPEERWTYGIPEAGGGKPITYSALGPTGKMESRSSSLAGYINYINTYKNNHYVLGDIDPNPQQAVSSAGG
jgi:cell wall-associated NlpC family hydrolase